MKKITFKNSRKELPALGLGTWKSAPGEVRGAIEQAIRIGYRHIDCAAIYGNEAEIGEALEGCFASGLITRDELWITSKLWNNAHSPGTVRPALEKTLGDLRLDALDLYLVHWPVSLRPGATAPLGAEDFIPRNELPIEQIWGELEEAADAGLVGELGVSNFSTKKLASLLEKCRLKPSVNQIELHPYLQQNAMLEFCRENGIHLTAYSPLGSMDRPETMKGQDEPILLEDPVIREIAQEIGASPAQVLLAWGLNRGTSTIPKSTHPGRLAENLAAAEIELSAENMARIADLDRHRRYVDGTFWETPGGPYSVATLWDE